MFICLSFCVIKLATVDFISTEISLLVFICCVSNEISIVNIFKLNAYGPSIPLMISSGK